jgi:hypothetical protein
MKQESPTLMNIDQPDRKVVNHTNQVTAQVELYLQLQADTFLHGKPGDSGVRWRV